MARMTVDEKIGQLNLPTSGDIGQPIVQTWLKILKKAKLADYLISSRLKRLKLQKDTVEKPLIHCFFFGMDVIHGYETTFPIP
jgi:beta-glucosidase